MDTENPNQSLQKSYEQAPNQEYSPIIPIGDQRPSLETIARVIVAKWIEIERIILKAPEIHGRESSSEEVEIVLKMMARRPHFTPKDFGDAIRKAAHNRLALDSSAFPRLLYTDIEEALIQMGTERYVNTGTPLELPQNMGGNQFWGEPSDALDREWPSIVEWTMEMRSRALDSNPAWADWRDRFWLRGNDESKKSSDLVLNQMLFRLKKWPEYRKERANALTKEIFKREYWASYPKWRWVADGIGDIWNADEINRIYTVTQKEIAKAIKAGADPCPTIKDFPDLNDCENCAIFDMYLSYWQDLQGTVTVEVVE